MRIRGALAVLAVTALSGLVLSLCGGSAATAGAVVTDGRERAASSAAQRVTKLLVVVEENHSLSQMRDGMPYTYSLAQQYGYATGYHAVAHPSLPDYLAIASGSTYGVTDDAGPAAHLLHGPSVFGQVLARGRSAAVYEQAMPGRCWLGNAGSYAVRHNPWTYFVDERRQCLRHDLPFSRLAADITAGTLPRAGLLVPDVLHDAHDGTLAAADDWFRDVMAAVFAGPDWQSGRLVVVLTADEDDRAHGNSVLTVVIHPSQDHHVVSTPLDHYSLARLYAEVAHVKPLRGARSAASIVDAFGLPVS